MNEKVENNPTTSISCVPEDLPNRLRDLNNPLEVKSLLILPGTWSIQVPELKKLIMLSTLEIEEVEFETDFPEELLNLTEIEEIDIFGIKSADNTTILRQILQQYNLKKLSWWDNELTAIPHELFDQESLIHLDLSENRLHSIPDDFQRLETLEELNLSSNPLGSISPFLGLLPRLERLEMYHCKLSSLEFSANSFQKLKYLDISYNKTDPISFQEGCFPNLIHMNMKDMGLLMFPDFKLAALESLIISYNPIREIPDTISGIKDLRILRAENCELLDISESIESLKKLEIVYLGNNELTDLPIGLSKLHSLRIFNAIKNNISSIPSEWEDLEELQQLELSWNKISILGPVLSKMKNLSHLILHSNQISEIDESFFESKSLTHINLGFNPIKSLPELSQMSQLLLIELGGCKDIEIIDRVVEQLCEISSLRYITLTKTLLNRIPSTISNLANLERINLPKSIEDDHKQEIRSWLPNSVVWFG